MPLFDYYIFDLKANQLSKSEYMVRNHNKYFSNRS